MSPDGSFAPSRPLDDLATEAIARGRRLRRRRLLVTRAAPATALVFVLAVGVTTTLGGDDPRETEVRTADDPARRDPLPPDRTEPIGGRPTDSSDTGAARAPRTTTGEAPAGSAPPARGSETGASPTLPSRASDRIAFAGSDGGRTAIFVAAVDGTNAQRLTTAAGNSFWPTWSPDATQLAFYNDRDTVNRIYVIGADGLDERLLVDLGSDHATQPAWSPGGDLVAFSRYSRPVAQASAATTAKGIWVVRDDGTALRQLAPTGGQPAWSPTGERLAYVDADGLYILDVATGTPRRIAGAANVPRWSPDGRRVAFGRVVDNREQLFVIDADGTDERRLVASTGYDSLPEWTPDSQAIVFTRDPDGRAGSINCTSLDQCHAGGADPSGLWLVPVNAGDPRPFIPTTSRGDYHARFAPPR